MKTHSTASPLDVRKRSASLLEIGSLRQRLFEEAAEDPYSLVLRLVPAWAMPPIVVTGSVRRLQRVVQRVRRKRATLQAFLTTVDLIAREVPLREEIARMFERPRGGKGWRIGLKDASGNRHLVEVASRYTILHRAGRLSVGLCPLHYETHPSFTIYPNGTFFCFGCLHSGDAADLLARLEGISRAEARRRLQSAD